MSASSSILRAKRNLGWDFICSMWNIAFIQPSEEPMIKEGTEDRRRLRKLHPDDLAPHNGWADVQALSAPCLGQLGA